MMFLVTVAVVFGIGLVSVNKQEARKNRYNMYIDCLHKTNHNLEVCDRIILEK